jgi:hypothetical protein
MAIIFPVGAGGGNDAGSLDDKDGTTRHYDNPKSTRTTISRPSDRYGSSSPIGSGTIDTSIDPDTGRAQQRIGGDGGATITESEESTTVVSSLPGYLAGDYLRDIEQSIEDATGGRAFGSPNITDVIGSGSAVRTVDLPEIGTVQEARQWLQAHQSDLRIASLVLGVVGTLLTLMAFVRD